MQAFAKHTKTVRKSNKTGIQTKLTRNISKKKKKKTDEDLTICQFIKFVLTIGFHWICTFFVLAQSTSNATQSRRIRKIIHFNHIRFLSFFFLLLLVKFDKNIYFAHFCTICRRKEIQFHSVVSCQYIMHLRGPAIRHYVYVWVCIQFSSPLNWDKSENWASISTNSIQFSLWCLRFGSSDESSYWPNKNSHNNHLFSVSSRANLDNIIFSVIRVHKPLGST